MKYSIILISTLIVFVTYGSSCNKAKTGQNIPACIQEKINAMASTDVRNPPGSVWQYTFREQSVFFIASDCCDQYSELYDGDCTLICAPDGGITGGGDGKCASFFKSRIDEKLIWQDPRVEGE